jgi:D-sedoheptulose 7-phosphate isomerase
MKVEALSANAAVLTCLGNDIGYENIFSHQIKIKADADDVLIALSGSGNSPNIINAIDMGNSLQMQTFAILGFTGGKAKNIAQHAIHFSVDDMQISEDLQVIVGHMLMQYLNRELRAVNG